jgi:hypothetical protein
MMLVGWIVSMVAFVIAVDYTCGRIDRVRTEVERLERAIKASSDLSTEWESVRSVERELSEIHKTLAGGIAALIALSSQAHAIDDPEKLSNERIENAVATLSNFISRAEWQRMVVEARESETKDQAQNEPTV